MVDATFALQALPLGTGAVWLAVGAWLHVKFRGRSPLERALVAYPLLTGTWAVLDGVLLWAPSAEIALAVSSASAGVASFAALSLFLASKWLYLGHARWDAAFLAPAIAAAGIGLRLTSAIVRVPLGFRPRYDPFLFGLFLAPVLAFVAGSILLFALQYRRERDIAPALRRWLRRVVGGQLLVLAVAAPVAAAFGLAGGETFPITSTVLLFPGVVMLVSLVPMTHEDLGRLLREVSGVPRRTIAAYLFHRRGEPLVALSSYREYPVEPERLEGVLEAVGAFLDRNIRRGAAIEVTGLRFDEEGVVAVRGQYVIAAALYDGPAYDAIRGDLVDFVRAFEARHWADLGTWEGATRHAEEASEDLSRILRGPTDVSRPA